jgi:hypothetical protein
VEAFIRAVYVRSYKADIAVSYPILMSVRDAGGTILAAVGFRYAKEEPLFLENYTGAPIEQVLRTPRERIAEIGNLASAGGGASIFLFAALASYLNFKGIDYGTERLKSLASTRKKSATPRSKPFKATARTGEVITTPGRACWPGRSRTAFRG